MLINGSLIYVENYPVTNPKANIIVTHGIAEHSGYYQNLAKALNKASYHVYLYDVRGHGRSQGKRGDIRSVFDFVKDLEAIVKKVQLTSDLPLYLLGHSMGGIITNLYALLHQDISGVIISSAPTKPTKNFGFNPFVLPFVGWMRVKTNFSDPRLSHLEKSEQLDPFVLESFTIRLAGQILSRALKYMQRNLYKYKHPILFVQGTDDKIVNPANAKEFIEALPSEDKTLSYIEDGYHNLFNDTVTDNTIKVIVKWLDERNRKKS